MGVSVEGGRGFPALIIEGEDVLQSQVDEFSGSLISLEFSFQHIGERKETVWQLEVWSQADIFAECAERYIGELIEDGPESLALEYKDYSGACHKYKTLGRAEYEGWLCREALSHLTRHYSIKAEIVMLPDGAYELSIIGLSTEQDDFCWQYKLVSRDKMAMMELELELSRSRKLTDYIKL
ncbi:hypothetical protein KC851_01095 [Candidatus Kaiserbacteria bacterium]|nr:hypothetical protein [Candidatus Kaiserbacteria bacterium]